MKPIFLFGTTAAIIRYCKYTSKKGMSEGTAFSGLEKALKSAVHCLNTFILFVVDGPLSEYVLKTLKQS